MRVVIATPNLISPTETFIRNHITQLRSRVDLRVLHNSAVPIQEETGRWIASLPRRVAQAAGARTGVARWRFMVGPLARYLRRVQASVVLTEYGTTGVGLMHACRVARVPLVVHFHGCDASARPVLDQYGRFYPELFGTAARIIAVSEAMMDSLARLGAPREKLRLCRYGVGIGAVRRASPGVAPPVAVSVGRFVDKKHPLGLLEAWASVARRPSNCELRMIGEGPLLPDARVLAEKLGIETEVSFLGARAHHEVFEELSRARLFVQHSVEAPDGDSEGTPNAILEAMAAGLPIVSTRHGGIADVVEEEVSGILVDEYDIVGMSLGIRRLIDDPSLSQRMGEAGRCRASTEYSLEAAIERLRSILEEAYEAKC